MANISKIKLPNNTTYDIVDNQPAVKNIPNTPCDIATFSGAAALPMPSLKVGIEAKQDLHGYDHPWVGGAGKNKLPNNLTEVTAFGVTYVTQEDGSIIANGTSTGWANAQIATNLLLKGGEQYILSGIPNVNGAYITIFKANGESGSWSSTYTTPSITISFNEDTLVNVRLSASSGTVLNNAKYKPMIRLATVSDATFEPYSNICPISGHTEANVTRCGKNLFDRDNIRRGVYTRLSGATQSGNAKFNFSSQFIKVKPNTIYSITMFGESYENGSLFGIYYDENKNGINQMTTIQNLISDNSKTFTTPSNAHYIVFTGYRDRESGTDIFTTANTMVCEGTPTAYEPYNGQTYNIQFKDGDNPLTVYGGSLDVVSGELVVDRVSVDLGTLNWSYASGNHSRMYASMSGIKPLSGSGTDTAPFICSQYVADSTNHIYDHVKDGTIGYHLSLGQVWVYDSRYSDATAFKTAMNGVQLVYELATPQTIQLTPTQVKSLLGSNNVWASTEEIIDCEYVRDKYDSITAKIAEHVDWAGVNNKPTIPTAVNNVTQTATTVTSDTKYELLFSNTADNTNRTEGTRKSSLLTFSPKPAGVQLTMNYDGSRPNNYGDITIDGGDNKSAASLYSSSAGMSYLHIKHSSKSGSMIWLYGGDTTSISTNWADLRMYPTDIELTGYDGGMDDTIPNTWDGTNTSLKAAVTAAKGTVTQTETTTSGNYELLFSGTSDDTTRTEGAKKSTYLKFDPTNKSLNIVNEYNDTNYKSVAVTPTGVNVLSAKNGVHNLNYTADDIVFNAPSNPPTWDGTNTSLKTALANKISKETNTTVSWTSSATGRTVTCMLAKIGTIVICTITGSTDANHSITAWTATQLGVGQIPAGYRPSSATEGRIPIQTGGATLTVNTVGTIAITTWSNLGGQMAFGGTLWWKTS